MFNSKIPWDKIVAVTNRHLCRGDFFYQIEKITSFGVKAVILREKDLTEEEYEQLAEKVLKICEKSNTECILHNFPQAAQRLGCHRLHMPLPALSKLSDQQRQAFCLLGTSVHSVQQAQEAESYGVDYVTAGHVFATECKKGLPPRGIDFLQDICQTVQVSVYAIGGIHPDNVQQVLNAGAEGACMMSEFMKSDIIKA